MPLHHFLLIIRKHKWHEFLAFSKALGKISSLLPPCSMVVMSCLVVVVVVVVVTMCCHLCHHHHHCHHHFHHCHPGPLLVVITLCCGVVILQFPQKNIDYYSYSYKVSWCYCKKWTKLINFDILGVLLKVTRISWCYCNFPFIFIFLRHITCLTFTIVTVPERKQACIS